MANKLSFSDTTTITEAQDAMELHSEAYLQGVIDALEAVGFKRTSLEDMKIEMDFILRAARRALKVKQGDF